MTREEQLILDICDFFDGSPAKCKDSVNVGPKEKTAGNVGQKDKAQPRNTAEDEIRSKVYPLAMDIYKDDTSYILVSVLPGYSKEEVDISLNDNILKIRAQALPQSLRGGIYSKVISNKVFERQFTLNSDCNLEDGIKATLDKGILSITITKSEESLPRKITID